MTIANMLKQALSSAGADLAAPQTWTSAHHDSAVAALEQEGITVKPGKASVEADKLILHEWEFSFNERQDEPNKLMASTQDDKVHFSSCRFQKHLVD